MADEKLVARIKEVGGKQAVEEWKSAGKKIDLAWANLSETNLREADFYCASLYCANLYESYLSGVDFRRADLRKANLSGADLRGANLFKAKLFGVNFTAAKGLSEEMKEKILNLLRESWE